MISHYRKQKVVSIVAERKVCDYFCIVCDSMGIFIAFDLEILFRVIIVEEDYAYGRVRLNEEQELVNVVYLKMDVPSYWCQKVDKKMDLGR